MPKRKQPSAIAIAWDQIVFGTDKYSAQSERDWAELWQRNVESEEFERTSIWDVGLLCELGWDQAARRGDWKQAQHCIERYFQHSRWEQDDPTVLVTLQARRARTYALCGDEAVALDVFEQVLLQKHSYEALPLALVLTELLAYCEAQPKEGIVSERLATFILKVAQRFARRHASKTAQTLRTFGELAALLESARTARAKEASLVAGQP